MSGDGCSGPDTGELLVFDGEAQLRELVNKQKQQIERYRDGLKDVARITHRGNHRSTRVAWESCTHLTCIMTRQLLNDT